MDDSVRSVRGSPDDVGGGFTRVPRHAQAVCRRFFYRPLVPVRPQSSGCPARKRDMCVIALYQLIMGILFLSDGHYYNACLITCPSGRPAHDIEIITQYYHYIKCNSRITRPGPGKKN